MPAAAPNTNSTRRKIGFVPNQRSSTQPNPPPKATATTNSVANREAIPSDVGGASARLVLSTDLVNPLAQRAQVIGIGHFVDAPRLSPARGFGPSRLFESARTI